MKLQHATIGSDPEMFLIDTRDNSFKSAIGIIPGTKEEPYRPVELPDGFGLQTDNVLIEFNVPPVALEDRDSFVANIDRMKKYIMSYLHNIDPNYGICCQASAYFDPEELTTRQARMFGCDPDMNCYTGQYNPAPKMRERTLRSAGFHWHVGFDNANPRDCINLIRYMDLFIGIPSVVLDTDTKRRSLYGKAGAFRLQPYGVEWRVLSSYFLQRADLIVFVHHQLMRAIQAFEDSMTLPEPNVVIDIINNSNTEAAMHLIDKLKLSDIL